MSFTNLFNSTCQIQRKTETQDAYGQLLLEWNTVATANCRLDTNPKSFRVSGENYKTTQKPYTLFLDSEIDVQKGDRILHAGIVYEIQDIQDYDSQVSVHHKEVYIIKTDNK